MLNHNRKWRATTLCKTLLTAGLLGAAALSTLGAGSAKAATDCADGLCTWAQWTAAISDPLIIGDKVFTWLSTAVVGDLATGTTTVSAVQPNPGDYLFNLDKDFTGVAFDFTYAATITTPGFVFNSVDLNSNANSFANPPSVLTATYTFTGGNSPIELKSTNGTPDLEAVTGGPTTITVNNNYDGNGAIDAMENSFQQTTHVPGPLPLLGAGAAFGFSRRIRSRIKGARLV